MFTGIVAAVGRIETITPLGAGDAGVRLHVAAGGLDLADVVIGDSIAIQGACMTVIAMTADSFDVDVSRESLDKTVGLERTGRVNLEKALRLADRLGGHLVSGHVDGVGRVAAIVPEGDSQLFTFEVADDQARYLVEKGSVAVDGVSLTVFGIAGRRFQCALIPHTLRMTTLGHREVGARVNIESDLFAKYVERMLDGRRVSAAGAIAGGQS